MKDTEHETHTALSQWIFDERRSARVFCARFHTWVIILVSTSAYMPQYWNYVIYIAWKIVGHTRMAIWTHRAALRGWFDHRQLSRSNNAFIFCTGEMLATDAHLPWGLFWTSSSHRVDISIHSVLCFLPGWFGSLSKTHRDVWSSALLILHTVTCWLGFFTRNSSLIQYYTGEKNQDQSENYFNYKLQRNV